MLYQVSTKKGIICLFFYFELWIYCCYSADGAGVKVPELLSTTNGNSNHTPGKDACRQPKVAGKCRAYILSWYYDSQTHRCKKFVYGGCGGNDNRFATCEQCEKQCTNMCRSTSSDSDICQLPKDAGPCKAYMEKWYFDEGTGSCKTFTYGGCRGNKNNFDTMADCENKCLRT